jgi:GNAT superfamily N-acetyltransferase
MRGAPVSDWSEVREETDPRGQSRTNHALRLAHKALLRVAPVGHWGYADYADPDETLPGLLGSLETRLHLAVDVVNAEIGPRVMWQAPAETSDDYDWSLQMMVVDFDAGVHDDPGSPRFDYGLDWGETGFSEAASAYRRECRWDFAPGKAGVWVIAVAPYGYSGGGDLMTWRGNLVGFVILMDRDTDDEYESLAHLWTATGWRRRGISTALVERARKLFPIQHVEGPITDQGRALLTTVAPDLLKPRKKG